MNDNDKQHRSTLQGIARRAMLERGLLPDFSAEALAELGEIQMSAAMTREPVDKNHVLKRQKQKG